MGGEQSKMRQQEEKLSFEKVFFKVYTEHEAKGEAPSDTQTINIPITMPYPKESILPIKGTKSSIVQYLIKVPYLADGYVPDDLREKLYALSGKKERELAETDAATPDESKFNREVSKLVKEIDCKEAPARDYVLIFVIASNAELVGGKKEAIVQVLREIGNELEKDFDPELIKSLLKSRK